MKNLCYLLIVVSFIINQPGIQSQTIQSIIPDSAYQGDELNVTISGEETHFSQATSIYLRQASNTSIYPTHRIIQSDTVINATFEFTNNHQSGIYDLHLPNEIDGDLKLLSSFKLHKDTINPEIISAQPDSAYLKDKIMVNISGSHTHFKQASNVIRLRQGTYTLSPDYQYATNYDYIKAEFDFDEFDPTGFYDLEIENESDGVLYFENAIEHLNKERPTPLLKSISPDTGYIDSNLFTTITGENTRFNQGTDVSIVLMNDNNKRIYTSAYVIDDTQVQAYFSFHPYHDTGQYNVHVYDYYDDNLIIENGFYLKPDHTPPTLHNINPDHAQTGETLEIQISGKNTHFQQGTASVNVWLTRDDAYIYPISGDVINDTLLNATFDFKWTDSTGYYDLYHYNVEDREIVCQNCFLLEKNHNAPGLKELSPTEGTKGQQLTLTVSGNNTHFQQATSVSYFLSNAGTSIFPDTTYVINDSIATLDFSFTYNLIPQEYHLYTSNHIDGKLKLDNAFTLHDYSEYPEIVSLSKDTIYYDENNMIHLEFNHAHFDEDSEYSLYLKRSNPAHEIQINHITITDNNNLTFTINPEGAVPGKYSIFAYNDFDGEIGLNDTIKIQHRPGIPSIINLVNDTLQLPGQYIVDVYCQHTHLAQTEDTVYLMNHNKLIKAENVIVYNDDHLKAFFDILTNDIGTYDLYITNSIDDTLIAQNALIYNAITNTDQPNNQDRIKIFPNPTSGLINIESSSNTINKLYLYSIHGQMLINKQAPYDETKQLDLRGFGKGSYILTIITNNDKLYRKIIVK